jgi:hypothetical protein
LRNTGIEAKGSFHLNHVPVGRYLLVVPSAGDTAGPTAPTPAAIRSTRCTPGSENPMGKPNCPSP